MSVLTLTPTGGDALDLDAGTTGIRVAQAGLVLPIPVFDEVFSEGIDSEGGRLVRSRPQNVAASVEVHIGGSSDLTDDEFYGLIRQWQTAIDACRRRGGELVYTPMGGDEVIYDVVSARIAEAPQDGLMMDRHYAASTAEFMCLPFGRLPDQTQSLAAIDSFTFDTLTNQQWLYDTGSGLSVSGGKLVPSSTTLKRIYRSGMTVADQTQTIKFTTGISVAASWDIGVGKRVSSSSLVYLNAQASGLTLWKYTGTATQLGSTTSYTFAAGTDYWLELIVAGNVLTGRLYTTDPNGDNPTSAVALVTHTLTSTDATTWGSGVYANPFIYVTPKATDWRYDDWRIEATTIKSSNPLQEFWALDVPGSAPALAKLTLTDGATQARDFAEAGQDDEAVAGATNSALIDSDSMTLGAGTQQTAGSGAYNPKGSGNTHIKLDLSASAQTVCSLSFDGYGTYRVKARVLTTLATSANTRVRMYLTFPGDRAYPWKLLSVGSSSWEEVDLGVVYNPTYRPGVQDDTLTISIQAYADTPGTGDFYVDYVEMIPAKRHIQSSVSGMMTASDSFLWDHDYAGVSSGDPRTAAGSYLRLSPGDNHLAAKLRRARVDANNADSQIADLQSVALEVTPRVLLMGPGS